MNKFSKSFQNALRGVGLIFNQRNFKIHVSFATIVVFLGFFLRIVIIEWLILLILFALVLLAEAINTSIENTLDCVSRDHRDDIRDAKDSAAGSVLIASFLSAVVGVIIFVPKILLVFGL